MARVWGILLPFSEPQLLHLSNGNRSKTTSQGTGEGCSQATAGVVCKAQERSLLESKSGCSPNSPSSRNQRPLQAMQEAAGRYASLGDTLVGKEKAPDS